jgi:citrate lyase subunit beta/citryl-CoA lyase
MHPAHAQTYLFVPGNRPDRFDKALASGAHRIILDLEDAVAPADKAAARAAVAQWMKHADAHQHAQVLIRINDCASAWHTEDLALASASGVPCVMLPKCESASQVASTLTHLPMGSTVLPLIESACGVMALPAIAGAPGVARLAFGALDYMVDLNIPAHSAALDVTAAQIVIASRAAGLPTPLAGVTTELNASQVTADMTHARTLGFGAKMCIHPSQIAAVMAALAPSEHELAWAQQVLHAWAASSGGALQLDGKMIDRPVVLRAEHILAQAALSHSTRP